MSISAPVEPWGRGGVWTTKLFGLEFKVEGKFLTIKLPSERKLFYREPGLTINRFGGTSIKYKSRPANKEVGLERNLTGQTRGKYRSGNLQGHTVLSHA